MLELSIVMPCLNEAKTLAGCIDEAKNAIKDAGLLGEVIVADNGSNDGSGQIAIDSGARVVEVPAKGYGRALQGGMAASRGEFILMGDCDGSYDFMHASRFVDKLRQGYDLVIGNRFRGGIEVGAMPWSHRYLGNPILSGLGRWWFDIPVGDFHCGLRAIRRSVIGNMGLSSPGMEFASEMVIQAALAGIRITEVPTTLRPDGRGRPSHLRTFRDGCRHLQIMAKLDFRSRSQIDKTIG
jgi:glycosyltransferase involved in cell wall biosynthesis